MHNFAMTLSDTFSILYHIHCYPHLSLSLSLSPPSTLESRDSYDTLPAQINCKSTPTTDNPNILTSTHHLQRKTSVKLFEQMMSRFEARGRHRYYRLLLHNISHSGVRGLLVHTVKNEVDNASKVNPKCTEFLPHLQFLPLQVEGDQDSPFLGQGLATLLELSLKVDKKIELLKEFDW